MIKKLLLLKDIIKGSSEKKMLDSLIKEAGKLVGYESDILPVGVNPLIVESIIPEVAKFLASMLVLGKIPESHAVKFANNEARNVVSYSFKTPDGRRKFIDAYMMMTTREDMPEEGVIDVDAPPASTGPVGPLRMYPTEGGEAMEDEPLTKMDLDVSRSVIKYLVSEYVKNTDVFARALDFSDMLKRQEGRDAKYRERISKLSPRERIFLERMNQMALEESSE